MQRRGALFRSSSSALSGALLKSRNMHREVTPIISATYSVQKSGANVCSRFCDFHVGIRYGPLCFKCGPRAPANTTRRFGRGDVRPAARWPSTSTLPPPRPGARRPLPGRAEGGAPPRSPRRESPATVRRTPLPRGEVKERPRRVAGGGGTIPGDLPEPHERASRAGAGVSGPGLRDGAAGPFGNMAVTPSAVAGNIKSIAVIVSIAYCG
jgi:hypothetical protein